MSAYGIVTLLSVIIPLAAMQHFAEKHDKSYTYVDAFIKVPLDFYLLCKKQGKRGLLLWWYIAGWFMAFGFVPIIIAVNPWADALYNGPNIRLEQTAGISRFNVNILEKGSPFDFYVECRWNIKDVFAVNGGQLTFWYS